MPLESKCRDADAKAVGFNLVRPQLRREIDADPIYDIAIVSNEESQLAANLRGGYRLTRVIVKGLSIIPAPPTCQ